jgi:flagellar protein FlaJ
MLRIGGDLVRYLETKADEMFAKMSEKIKSLIERMGLIIEIYMILSVVTTLSLFVLFISAGGLSIIGAQGGLSNFFIGLYIYLILPIMSIMTIIVAHYSQPRQKVFLRKTVDMIFPGLLISVVLGVLTLIFSGGYRFIAGVIDKYTTISLLISINTPFIFFSGFIWYHYRKETKTFRGINQKIASFLEDVSEARKTGLSPERSIIQTMKRDYGPLSRNRYRGGC